MDYFWINEKVVIYIWINIGNVFNFSNGKVNVFKNGVYFFYWYILRVLNGYGYL